MLQWQCSLSSGLVPSGPFQFSSLMQLSYHIASSLEYKAEKQSYPLKMFSNPLLLNVHTQRSHATVREAGDKGSRIKDPALWIKKNIQPHFPNVWRWFFLGKGKAFPLCVG